MTAPNMALITTITGKNSVANVSNISSNIVYNASSSNTIYKLNTILVTNVTSGNTVDITISLQRNSYNYRIANTVTISPKTTFVALGKDAPIYLEEGDGLNISASANSSAEMVVSYEIIG